MKLRLTVKMNSHVVTLEEAIKAFEKATNTTMKRVYASKDQIEKKYRETNGDDRTASYCKLMYITGKGRISKPFNKSCSELAKVKTLSVEEVANIFVQES